MIKNKNYSNQNQYFINRQIRASHVLCIDQNNENRGVIPLYEALKMAESSGLDLVQIANDKKNGPTCKILDYSKFKYELSKKDKLAKKKQRESLIKVKEIKFRPTTDQNDLSIKAKQTQEFINDGHKVRVSIVFRGRELSHRQVGLDTLNQFMSMLTDVQQEESPNLNGRNLSMLLSKMREKENA